MEKERIDDFSIESFDSNCGSCKNDGHVTVENILKKNKNRYSKFHLICSGGCLNTESIDKDLAELDISEIKLCFNLFINQSVIDTYIDKGCYLTSPGWLNRWEHYVVDTWKFDKNIAREFFKENTSQLLLLDTGVNKKSIHKLQEFSEFIDIPFKLLPVGLDYFSLFIKNIILELKYKSNIEYQEEQRKISLLQNRKISDYSMIFDWIGTLPEIIGEKAIIDKVFDLIKMLFAAQKIVYMSLEEDNKINTITSFPEGCDQSELLNTYKNGIAENYQWTKSGDGFYIKIVHNKIILGIVLIDDLIFPEYKESYLNNFLDIVNVFGLAIYSSRVYLKLLNTEKNLILKESYFQQLFKNSPESILVLDKDLNIKDVNQSFLEMFKHSKNDVTNMKINDLLSRFNNIENYIEYIKQIKEGKIVKSDIKIKSQNSGMIDLQMLAYPVKNSDELMGYYILLSDITDRKNKENQIIKMAYEDSLTGLQNRRSFEINLRTALNNYQLKKEKFALFIIDLNKFKEINDNFGHKVGDDVLVRTAAKLRECTRRNDMIFRIGGDEFAFIMPEVYEDDLVKNMGKRILKNLDIKLSSEESDFEISASVGVSICPDDGLNLETLYRKADEIMYESKKKGRY